MENTKKLPVENKTTTEEYNNIPVHYCSKCLSLKIMNYDNSISYCDDCGSTEIESTHINNYLQLVKNKKEEDGKRK
jgi:ribosomal protein L37AE/L43A